MKLSVVIPIYNEQRSLPALTRELLAIGTRRNYDLDIVIVDDGSTDGSWETIQSLGQECAAVRGVRLRRNFGKAAALSVGFQEAHQDIVITMDGDLQDDPGDIPRFLDEMQHGLDVVNGWKRHRRDSWSRVVASRAFNWIVRRITGVPLHDHNCGFKAYRREIFREIPLYGELHRFIPVLAAGLGYAIGEVEVHHRPRGFGKSRYGIGRIPKGLLDLITVQFLTSFRHRPQHLLGMVGMIGLSLGTALLFVLLVAWFLSRAVPGFEIMHLHQRAVFYLAMTAMILGSQFLVAGFLAELLVAFYHQDSGFRPTAFVAERTSGHVQSDLGGFTAVPATDSNPADAPQRSTPFHSP